MTRAGIILLDTGDFFPSMSFKLIGDDFIRVPEGFGGRWNVLIFYRGHW